MQDYCKGYFLTQSYLSDLEKFNERVLDCVQQSNELLYMNYQNTSLKVLFRFFSTKVLKIQLSTLKTKN